MAKPKEDKFKSYRITYFEGDYFSSHGEDMKEICIGGRNEAEAERIFRSMFNGCYPSLIKEVTQ